MTMDKNHPTGSSPASTAASEQQASVSGLLPLPAQHEELRARWRCEDCGGDGEIGEPMDLGYFQPPERARCSTCSGAGQVPIVAYTDDQMHDYARAALSGRATIPSEADERAQLAATIRETILSAKAARDWKTADLARAALHQLAALTHRATTATRPSLAERFCGMDYARTPTATPGIATTAADQQGAAQAQAGDTRDVWQPIETAPADCILLLAYEFDRPGDWRIKVGGYWNGEWEVFGASWTPTRWMPLPGVPAVSDYEARRAAMAAPATRSKA